MFSKINSFSTRGIDGYRITVEVDVSNGLPSFVMVGYLAEEVREAQERVRTALRNAGFCLPPKRITVNLSPAGVRKEGTGCDLAIAAGILRCLWEQGEKAKIRKTDETCPEMDGMEDEENNSAPDWDQWAFIGELGLDGSIKPLTGVLSMVYEARRCGMKRVFLSEENVQEGRAVDGIEIVGVRDVKALTGCLQHPEQIHGQWFTPDLFQAGQEEFDVDFDEIVGLPLVRQATEAAAAGRHNILYIGPAGTGKTYLAVAAAVVFVLLERRAAEPIIPMGLFRNRNFVLCSVTGLLLNISFMGALNYLPTYFQIVDDLSPEVAGLVCTATSVGILVTSTATGWAASKTGRYKGMLVAMCVVSTVGLFLLSRMRVHEALWVPVLYLFVLGFGMGLGMQLLVLVVQNEFPHAMVGTATAANNFFRQIGASVGTALVGALFTMRLTADVAGKLTHVDNLSLATLTPQIVDSLPASAQSVIAAGYSDALLPLFLWFVPLMLACLVMMLLLKRHPLATTINHGGAGK